MTLLDFGMYVCFLMVSDGCVPAFDSSAYCTEIFSTLHVWKGLMSATETDESKRNFCLLRQSLFLLFFYPSFVVSKVISTVSKTDNKFHSYLKGISWTIHSAPSFSFHLSDVFSLESVFDFSLGFIKVSFSFNLSKKICDLQNWRTKHLDMWVRQDVL